ncbi:succinyldiaminopimelate transaminase [Amycolatopsis rubida]|uniref:Succinyldiaminopimelate transaminase n=1 Tax=Amycolatopsis rubida TaxID=112413 RepID=A0ABX0BJ43_9PSEU|nr:MULTISPECIES: succinyldiaminopimelate transaminase [Amycolatopsis]MYW90527.1 succinyldiaminopimelate transaminase [Amycolatopsis rubida]NEC55507.1 succinyldiaminopimelate transaminase [Amycolatopsis rubida]OAP22305.1 LL-diaminopimelate aminotransferase [Amycolatopsis sp. M39]
MTRLPDFPWDSLAEVKARAQAHPGGIVDLSVGTPVDPVPDSIRAALASVSEIPGYPATHGTPELRETAVAALRRRYGITGVEPDAVLPTIGSKEAVAWLPRLLGFGPGDMVVIPELAYPTYEVGALLAGAEVVRADGLTQLGPRRPAMIWLNSPSNPTGRVLGVDHLRKVVEWARDRGTVVVSDECYLSLGWEAEPLSVLHPSVHGGQTDGLLAVHSLSKSANLASYRAGFVTGDPALVKNLLEVRKHAGMIVPRPVQQAMVAALSDDEALAGQRERYRARRVVLRKALQDNGFEIHYSEAGLYLWATRGESAQATVEWLAERGILVAPGTFYGPAGRDHVRVALTSTDERIEAAAERLAQG